VFILVAKNGNMDFKQVEELIKRILPFNFCKKGQAGIEIDENTLKVVCFPDLKDINDCFCNSIPLPAETIEKGSIIQSQALIEGLSGLKKHKEMRNQNVVITIVSRKLLIRHFELPALTAKELDEAMKWEAKQLLSRNSNRQEMIVDWCNLGSLSNDPAKTTIFLAAIPKELALGYCDAFKIAKLSLVAIDNTPSALRRWLLCVEDLKWGDSSILTVGILHFSQHLVNFVILKEGQIHFARSIAHNLAKKGSGENFMLGIKSSLDYYLNQLGGDSLARIIVSGKVEMCSELQQKLEELLEVPFFIGEAELSQYAVAAGLALRGLS
jgi:Tfp pilus assembly PilM family ATPase